MPCIPPEETDYCLYLYISILNPTASNVDLCKCFIDDSDTMNSFAGVIGISKVIKVKDHLPLFFMMVVLLVNSVYITTVQKVLCIHMQADTGVFTYSNVQGHQYSHVRLSAFRAGQ